MQPKHVRYFNTQADLRRSFLHPGGEWATQRLLQKMPPLDATQTVLEFGCGMGHTAGVLLQSSPASYIGLDASPGMLAGARAHLKQFGDRVALVQCDLADETIPVASNSVDVVYAESVVAIIDPRRVLKEAHRVLKQEGMLLINDRIWRESMAVEQRREYNAIGRSEYGFPFASDDPGTVEEWKVALNETGFICQSAELLDMMNIPEEETRMGEARGWRRLLQGIRAPGAIVQSYRDRRLSQSLAGVWDHMEPWLFCALKR
jgi:SAM-dependent methyltransferase